jgi:hypothetical protein
MPTDPAWRVLNPAMRRPSPFFAAFSVAIVGCAAAPQPPPHVLAPREPLVGDVWEIDPASLPRPVPIAVERDAETPTFLWKGADYQVDAMGDVVAQVHIGGSSLYSTPEGPTGAVVRRFCAESADAASPVSWISFSPIAKTILRVTVTGHEGTVDAISCKTKAVSAWRVEAPAIVPGVLYAYRSSTRTSIFGVELPLIAELVPSETIEVIGPGALWLSSTSSDERQAWGIGAPFTHASVEIERGSSASLTVAVTLDVLGRFAGMSPDEAARFVLGTARFDPPSAPGPSIPYEQPALRVVSIHIDWVWPAADVAPSMLVSFSPLHARREEIGPSYLNATPAEESEIVTILQRLVRRMATAARARAPSE